MYSRFAAVLLITIAIAGCPSKPSGNKHTGQAIVAGTKNEFYTAISAQKIRTAEGAKADSILSKDGSLRGVNIVAREKEGAGAFTCECSSGCEENGGDRCLMQRIDDTGSSTIWCSGSCHNSESNPCGPCNLIWHNPGGSGGSGSSGGHANPGRPDSGGSKEVSPTDKKGTPPAAASGSNPNQ
jgi:hypothetical protein